MWARTGTPAVPITIAAPVHPHHGHVGEFRGIALQPYTESFNAGELIFAEGDPPSGAYLIESGRIEIATLQQGKRRVLGELGPGMLLGEMAVIDDSPRTATARALTDCRLTPIDAPQFAERLAAADPVVRALLMSQLTRYRSALATLTGAASGAKPCRQRRADDARAFDKIRLESELRAALERKRTGGAPAADRGNRQRPHRRLRGAGALAASASAARYRRPNSFASPRRHR